MDLVASCVAFVAVARAGSFTQGAAAAGIPQPVASRRVAALEQHLGAAVLERTSRTVVLTPFGRDMLPAAKRLADLADTLRDDAERARQREFDLAVPPACTPASLARLIAAGRDVGLYFDVVPADPGQRVELLRTREVHAAITAVPPGEGDWEIPLGLAAAVPVPSERRGRKLYLEELRAGRDEDTAVRRVWVQPEDAVPHVLDRIVRLGNSVGLRASQVRAARTAPGAASRVLNWGDLLLCSRAEARTYGLVWRPVGEEAYGRGYTIASASADDGRKLRAGLSAAVAECLGE